MIAITGGIGEGKSTVLAMLADLGYVTASADAIARDVFSRPHVNAQLAAAAGVPSPIRPADLRAAISASDAVRAAVNAITHPPIVQAISDRGADFVEVPLLLEAGLQDRFDRVWVVTCGPEEQRRRLHERYRDDSHIDAMLAAQLPTRAKIPFADAIIRTNGSLEAVRRLVSEAIRLSWVK